MATVADLAHNQNYRVPNGFFTSGLGEIDPAVQSAVRDELRREQTLIELIASVTLGPASGVDVPALSIAPNFTTRASMPASVSCFWIS